MKPKIISILLLLIIAFSTVTLSGCWLLNNDSDDGDSSLDTDGSSGSKPARSVEMWADFEDKLYTENEEIILEVRIGTSRSILDIIRFYEENGVIMDKDTSFIYIVAQAVSSVREYNENRINFFQGIKESKLTVIHKLEGFNNQNYPLRTGEHYTHILVNELNTIQLKIPKNLFVENAKALMIYSVIGNEKMGFAIYYEIQDDGIFISKRSIEQ